jgi:hypothetical protein
MINSNFKPTPIDSVLEIKSSGVNINIHKDLLLEQGKSIAELLYEEKKEQQKNQK